MSNREERTAWWGSCDDEVDCGMAIIIYPHPDSDHDLPEDDEDWEDPLGYIHCPVCGSSIMWGGTDHPADILKGY